MSTSTQMEKQVSLKLLVAEERNKVIFAEVGKDFVDILRSLLALPLGTIAILVEKDSDIGPVTVGCLNSLYHSVTDLDEQHMLTETFKELLLQQKNSSLDFCNNCLEKNSNEIVKDAPNFIVTDNLIIRPNLSLDQLSGLGVKYKTSLKEMIVTVTDKQVLDLLKCSLLSQSVLTDVFLKKELVLENKSFNACPNIQNNSNMQIKVKLFMRNTDGESELLFALAEEDFAVFLFSFLTFSLGDVGRVLGENSFVGSIHELFISIANLDGHQYLSSEDIINKLLPEGGLKGPKFFMVTNDLVVKPMSPIIASVLNSLESLPINVTEKVVFIGVNEGLNIYKAALTSTSALSNGLSHLLN